jgi:hypothetical protein
MGIRVDRGTIGKIGREMVYYDNPEDYSNRFKVGQKEFNRQNMQDQEFTNKDWKDLREEDLVNHLDEYRNDTQQKAVIGSHITKTTINWLEQKKENPELSENEKKHLIQIKNTCKLINDNQEIDKFILDKIQHTKLSQREISDHLNEMGFEVSHDTVGKVAKEIIYQDDKEGYERRFPFYDKLSDDRIKIIDKDIQTTNLTMNQIANLRQVSITSIRKISEKIQDSTIDYDHSIRFPQDKTIYVGRETHKGINNELTIHLKENFNTLYVSEPRIYPNSRMGTDGLIPNDKNFLQDRLTNEKNGNYLANEIFNINSLNPEELKKFKHIKAIQVDFTSDISDDNIISKTIKYESPDTLTMIVGTQWYNYEDTKALPPDHSEYNQILYSENTKVISHNLFADFVGLEKENLQKINEIIQYNYNHDLDSLISINDSNDTKTFNTQDLKEYLINNQLIKKDFEEYFKELERKFGSKPNCKKQRIIDEYI